MLSRWGGLAALVVTLLAGLLVIVEITDGAMRRWWAGHALTTGTVSGLLVLLITLLVVDQVVRLRQLKARARTMAAQAAIIMTQAIRTSDSISQATAQGADPSDHDGAADEFRTYMMMLLVGAPVLIDAKASRNFLEQAQVTGGIMALALGLTAGSSSSAAPPATRLDDAVQRLQAAATPLLAVLDPKTQAAIRGDESALPGRNWSHLGKGQHRAATPPARLPPSLGCYGPVRVAIVAVKNGWLPLDSAGDHWQINSVGWISGSRPARCFRSELVPPVGRQPVLPRDRVPSADERLLTCGRLGIGPTRRLGVRV